MTREEFEYQSKKIQEYEKINNRIKHIESDLSVIQNNTIVSVCTDGNYTEYINITNKDIYNKELYGKLKESIVSVLEQELIKLRLRQEQI